MYKLPLKITSTNVDPCSRLSVPGFLRLFQDAAIEDAEIIGYNASKTMSKGLLWVFSRVYIRFYDMPKYLSQATLVTKPGEKKACFFPRYATLLNDKGEKAAELSSIWALIHADTRKIEMRPELDSVDETTGDELPLPGKIVAKPCNYRCRRTITYADLDLNGHMNNVRYVEMLLDLHDAAFYEKNQLSELLIQYEAEIHEGETVELFVDNEDTYVRGVVGDHIAFEASVKYTQKAVR